MAVKRVFNGATIIKPGAYSRTIVQNLSGFPLQETGTVSILGEADGGEPRVLDILTREAIQSAKTRYKSGPIADALGLLVAPSSDPRIVNGASKIIVYKTNLSTVSTADVENAVPATILTLTSKNWGVDENNINYTIADGSVTEIDAVIEGTVAEGSGYDFSTTNDTLILDINGTTHTYTSSLSGATETAAAVIVDLNDDTKWSPGNAAITAAANTVGTGIKITIDTVVTSGGELDYGAISVDATSTADTILGITGTARGIKGSKIFTVKKGTLEETSSDIGGVDQLSIAYTGAGTAATFSIQDAAGERKLTTTIAGAGADDLDIVLENSNGVNQLSIQELADQINVGNYTCTAVAPNPDRNANELDYHSATEFFDVTLLVRADIFDTKFELDTFSTLVDAAITSNAIRAIAPVSTPVFLTGGALGTSANSDFTAGLTAFEGERINTVVSLISQDAGSLTIDSINAAVKTHCKTMSSTTGKSERNAYVSNNAAKADLRTASRALNSQYVSIVGQQIKVLDVAGDLVWQDPWAFACICAGLQAGSEVGTPITFKVININDLRVEDGSWDPKVDYSTMIEDGILIAEPVDAGGFRVVLGNTSYVSDASFVFNRQSVVEAVGYVAYDLRFNLEAVFTGTKAKTGTAGTITSFTKARMEIYLGSDIIVGDDDNAGLGYKNLSVTLTGGTAAISVSITPVQGIDFLLPTIYIADIVQSAA